jgi:dephospho-CoA kinase
MKIPKIIAVCGQKRCGKDTLANFINSQYGHKNVKIAENIKVLVKTLFGFTDDQVESDIKEVIDPHWGISPRKAMQFIGTEMFQYKIQELLPDIQRNIWIKSTIQQHIISSQDTIVISDLRFYHEYIALKKFDVFVIKIMKNKLGTLTDTNVDTNVDTHASETEYKTIPADLVIFNDATKQNMFDILLKRFNQIE